ncbi:MAG: gamma-glutamyltransferase [Opitutales bacterium]
MNALIRLLVLIAGACALVQAPLSGQPIADGIFRTDSRVHPVVADEGMVVSAEAAATRAGVRVLREGGNAVDAAVTTAFTLAVTLPRAGNLGGGGFLVVHSAVMDETRTLDFRETAPAAASRDMFLGPDGEADPALSRRSHLAVGVPGTVAGLLEALERYGTRPRARVLEPAIRFARTGIAVSPSMADSLAAYREELAASPAALALFFEDGDPERPLSAGSLLLQPDLGQTLERIRDRGRDGFYRGETAAAIAADMQANGGLITLRDLAGFRPVWREPVTGTYRGYRIASMPPPSSGGIHLVQMLNILGGWDIEPGELGSAAHAHRLIETMRLAFADRSKFLGDPDFVRVPQERLTDQAYADRLRVRIDPERATPSSAVEPGHGIIPTESFETTHISVIDRLGNAASVTLTLNSSYGIRHVVPGTGFFLNNEMDDFSAQAGVPNLYGLVGGEANAVAPGKRMLSSMTPTLVFGPDGNIFAATGSPGGPRIITTVLQVLVNLIDFRLNPAEATLAPRVHHQWLPDVVRIERGMSPDTRALLEAKGHRVETGGTLGAAQTIVRLPDKTLQGFSDSRRRGGLAAGH